VKPDQTNSQVNGSQRPKRITVCFADAGEAVPVKIGFRIVEDAVRPCEISHGTLFAPGRVLAAVAHPCMQWLWAVLAFGLLPLAGKAQTTSVTSFVIESAGRVEFATPGQPNWQVATNGLALNPGDRVRTREQSRAAIQLSDRSVIRLNERTTLEILPPRNAEKKRFGLPGGSIFFFNREKPASVEFDTPLAAGAIRGTEFLLEVAAADQALHLALIDGLVSLQTQTGEVSVQSGEDLRLAPGQLPQKTALVNATALIQWALYYPAVLDPADLQLTGMDESALSDVLKDYRAGDLLGALAVWPEDQTAQGAGPSALRAQLLLAVGRVNEAEQMLAGMPSDAPAAVALRELIATVRGESERRTPALRDGAGETRRAGVLRSASESLARSYTLQSCSNLEGARAAARRAVELAPALGFARARLAELEFAFGQRKPALEQLKRAYEFSPRLAPAYALQGFVLLEQGEPKAALVHFEKARELDAAFGPAWLGRGLCLMRERKFREARSAFQAAVALEPQRGLFRNYLGKAASELGDNKAAEKEFRLAKQLDANDPTAWLYSALHLWQENRINEALRDLEKSSDLNDNQAAFRSQLLLDGDRSVRSANLAAIYEDAGLSEVSRHVAARSVAESYANFSGHLFLANSLQSEESATRFDLRLESARQSELLVANLLAPPGAGNLSQMLSQSEHLRFFGDKPIGVSSLSEYGSGGDWRQTATAFGSFDGFSYAFDASCQKLNGEQPNGESESRQFILTAKQRVTANDEAYFQIGTYHADMGDVASYYDPAQAQLGFRASEEQLPTLYGGWHHAWSPGSHTLLLVSRLDDRFLLVDPVSNVIFVRNSFGSIVEVQAPPAGPPVSLDFDSDFTLYSAELQHIWETPRHSLVVGGRWQSGDLNNRAQLDRAFETFPSAVDESLERGNAYAYLTWRLCDSLRLIGGVSYDHLEFPANTDLPPLSSDKVTRDQISPKAGLLFTPWERGLIRASYTKSLGGLYFDNSVRLEPSQVAGFNQTFRSLIPESVAGLVSGTEFTTAGVGFDQSLPSGTWFGVEAEWLTSDGERAVGTLTNSFPIGAVPDSMGSTQQKLEFRERNLSAYAAQLIGESFSLGARYRVSEAELAGRFPEIPDGTANLELLEQDQRALLHQVSLTANFNHRSGVFAQWESAWFHQSSFGYTPSLAGEDFWQHNLVAGYRFPRRHAEIRVGLLNLADTDYRLNPLNLHADLARGRTLALSLRLNF